MSGDNASQGAERRGALSPRCVAPDGDAGEDEKCFVITLVLLQPDPSSPLGFDAALLHQ